MKKIKHIFVFISLLLFFSVLFLLPQRKRVIVIAERADIYLQPNINSTIIETIEKGSILSLLSQIKIIGNWYYVIFPSEKKSPRQVLYKLH